MERRDIKPILSANLYKRIEEDVVKLHIELQLSIPVKPAEVAERLGYIVRTFSELYSEENDLSELRMGKDGKRRDGLSFYDTKLKKYVIWVNDIDSRNKEHNGFTIMHEIGHIRMGHKGDSQLAEMVANYYAAYAMVPSPLPNLFKCLTFVDIANIFKVSLGCANNCFKRFINWISYSGPTKQYEKDLVTYYKNQIEGG